MNAVGADGNPPGTQLARDSNTDNVENEILGAVWASEALKCLLHCIERGANRGLHGWSNEGCGCSLCLRAGTMGPWALK